jgi:hypothetical protein
MQDDSTKTADMFGDTPSKRCKGCKQVLPLDNFYAVRCADNGRLYRYSYCKKCGAENRRLWHFTPQGQRSHRKIGLRALYGMTLETYEAMLAGQNGLCAICGGHETRKNRAGNVMVLAVDHDHATGNIRGLLCSACNSGLASFRDDPTLLKNAVSYLERQQQD